MQNSCASCGSNLLDLLFVQTGLYDIGPEPYRYMHRVANISERIWVEMLCYFGAEIFI